MRKHTQGPWKVLMGNLGEFDTRVSSRVKVSIPTFGEHIQSEVYFSKHTEKQDVSDIANARLIAAAPELLEALVRAVENCPCSVTERMSGHKTECYAPDAIEAIARAEGKE